jgi:hypothetical protein
MLYGSVGYMELATGLVLVGLGIGAGVRVQMTHKSEFALVQIAFTLGYGLVYIARFINDAVAGHSLESIIHCDKIRIALQTLFYMLAV